MAQQEGIERISKADGAVPLTRQSGLEQGFATSATDGNLVSTFNTALGTPGASSKTDLPVGSPPTTDVTNGIAVFECQSGNQIHLQFGGTGNDNASFTYEVWVWEPVRFTADGPIQYWHATYAAVGTATMGAKAIGWITNGRWCDGLTKTAYLPEAFATAISAPGNEQPATLSFDPCGPAKIEVRVSRAGGSGVVNGVNVWCKRT